MDVSRYNSEGYPDPTTYGALSNIEKETKAARAGASTDRWCMYAPRFREILPGTLQMHESTAVLLWSRGISPLLRICCFRSFLTITI